MFVADSALLNDSSAMKVNSSRGEEQLKKRVNGSASKGAEKSQFTQELKEARASRSKQAKEGSRTVSKKVRGPRVNLLDPMIEAHSPSPISTNINQVNQEGIVPVAPENNLNDLLVSQIASEAISEDVSETLFETITVAPADKNVDPKTATSDAVTDNIEMAIAGLVAVAPLQTGGSLSNEKESHLEEGSISRVQPLTVGPLLEEKNTEESSLLQIDLSERLSTEDLAMIDGLDEDGPEFTSLFDLNTKVDSGLSPSVTEGAATIVITPPSDRATIMPPTIPSVTSEMSIVEQSVLDQVAKTVSIHRFDVSGVDSVTIELTPKELGTIKIEISVDKGTVSADILTQTVAVKEVLEKNQSFLQDALIHSGFQIDHFSVNVGDFSDHSQSFSYQDEYGTDFAIGEESGRLLRPALVMAGEILNDRYRSEGGISFYV
jgi:flagellar hook-length control protein FliK